MSIYLHVIDWCFPSVKTETGWSLKLKCLLSDLLQKIICSPLVFGLRPGALGVMEEQPSFPEGSVSARAQVPGYPLCTQSKVPVLGVEEQKL